MATRDTRRTGTDERAPDASVVTRSPFPASKKIYVSGRMHGISVAMREVTLCPTPSSASDGAPQANDPVTLYDTSGPYTDPNVTIDLAQGLAPLRQAWIEGRGDTEVLSGPSSAYRQAREIIGRADAEATTIYAAAYNRSSDSRAFYEFLKTMEIYQSTIDSGTSLVLTTDGDFYKFLK